MKILILFYLCLHSILASLLKTNQNDDILDAKTTFDNLPEGPFYEILNHLEEGDRIHLAKTSRGFYKYDQREVVLTLPLLESKEPTKFMCEHLKLKKSLVIKIKRGFDINHLFKPESLAMKYIKCLSGIEELRFGKYVVDTIILASPNFKIHEFFPKLRHLKFKISVAYLLELIPYYFRPDIKENLEEKISFVKNILKEKIAQMKRLEFLTLDIIDQTRNGQFSVSSMVSELKELPNFKRLSIKHDGNMKIIRDIISHANLGTYKFDLEAKTTYDLDVGEFIRILPKRTENFKLFVFELEDTEKVCDSLSTMKNLKKFELKIGKNVVRFNCLLESLPSTLNEFNFNGNFENIDLTKIILPKQLHSATLGHINSNIFELFANHVLDLTATISDPENLLKIEKPIVGLKSLVLNTGLKPLPLEFWFKFFGLLPNNMEKVEIRNYMSNLKEFDILKEKISTIKKRISVFRLTSMFPGGFIRKLNFIFDGSKMIESE